MENRRRAHSSTTLAVRVARLPDVASVSWASNLPLWARPVNGLQVEGQESRSGTAALATVVNTVDLDYFETAGVVIDAGRGFTSVDREPSVPVAIVNQRLAHEFWPDGGALGKRLRLPGEKQRRQVSASPGTQTTPRGPSRRSDASMCRWNRVTPMP